MVEAARGRYQATTLSLVLILALAGLAFLPASLSAAVPPQPTYDTANVDGNTAEWDTANDFFADMYRAGDPTKKVESKLYLRYDCATSTMYALVLTVTGVPALVEADNAWIAIDGASNKKVSGNSGDNGTPPDFAWVDIGYDGDNGHARGWEASFTLTQGTYKILAHVNVFDDDESQTSAVDRKTDQDGISLVVNCGVGTTGKLEVRKSVSPTTDPGKFNLQIDSVTETANASHGDTTGEKTVNTGTHTVGETAGTSTNLNDYTTSIECKDNNGTGSIVASASNAGPLNVTVNANDDIVCTISNTRKTVAPALEAAKKVTLFDDKNGNGKANPGDILKYEVTITNSGTAGATGVIYNDTVDANTNLLCPLPPPSQGSVTTCVAGAGGNLSVNVGNIGIGGFATIVYYVEVRTGNFKSVSNQGTTTGSNIVDTPTDDPDTPSDDDPTVLQVDTGSITVRKVVVGESPATAWQFSGTLGDFTLPAAGGETTFGALSSGSYTITEATKTGYTTTVSCTNGASGFNSVTVNLLTDQSVTCTFTNTRQTGKLEVRKSVSPTTDPGKFNLQIDGSTEAANAGHGGTTGEKTVNTGTHTVGETAGTSTNLNDYTTAIGCKDNNGAGSIVASASNAGPLNVTVNANDDIVCTISNTRKAAAPVGGDPPIYGNIVVFPTPEIAWGSGPDRDFNRDGDLQGCILRYRNLQTGQDVSTGLMVSCGYRAIDIYEETVVFVGEGNQIRYYNIATGVVVDTGIAGSHPTIYGNTIAFAANGTIHYFDLVAQTLTDTGASGFDPVIHGSTIAYLSGTPPTVRYYNLESRALIDTGAIGQDVGFHGNVIAFTTDERAVAADLNGDGRIIDPVIRYYSLVDQTVTNTGATGAFPAVYGNRIAFATKESAVRQDLNGDGRIRDWVIRYYDLEARQALSTGRLGIEPDIYDDVISFWVMEPWVRRDLNRDGDRSDPIVQTYRIPTEPADAVDDGLPLLVSAVKASPNPARAAGEVRFVAQGLGIQEILVQIYNLAGKEVYSSDFVRGREVTWLQQSNDGLPVPNGVYLYVVTIRGAGVLQKSEVGKLVVLR